MPLVRLPAQRQALFAAAAGRCLIADEMGLGKTIQAIAAVEIMARHFGVERVLIVCPTSLKHQWEREIAKFADRSTQVIGGLRPRRQQLFAADAFYKITNYDTIHRDLDLISTWSPDLVILDEAQRIKNWNTRAARNVKRLASPYAIVLTGTPLENRLEELVSIVQFVDQHRLGPTFRFLAEHQIHDPETGRVVGYKSLDSIGKTLATILIRRKKDQVLNQLPERLDKHLFVPMTPKQMTHHEENREAVARIVQKWRRSHYLSEADQRRLMICLQNMRMSCDSTYLLDHKTDFGVKADELATLLDEMLEQPQTKVVIFSQWLRMHELLARRLERRQWEHVMFHGGVPGPQQKSGGPFPRGRPLQGISRDRRRRRRTESPTCLRGGQHGPPLESGGAGTADRTRASTGPASAGASRQFRRPGNDRGGNALDSEIQEVPVCRCAGRRGEGSFSGRQPAHALHGHGSKRDGAIPPQAAQDPPAGTSRRRCSGKRRPANGRRGWSGGLRGNPQRFKEDFWSGLLQTGLSHAGTDGRRFWRGSESRRRERRRTVRSIIHSPRRTHRREFPAIPSPKSGSSRPRAWEPSAHCWNGSENDDVQAWACPRGLRRVMRGFTFRPGAWPAITRRT